MNKWLDSVVGEYKKYFNDCKNPIVWEVGSRDGDDGVELAERIYVGKPKEFWEKARVICMEPNPDQALIIMDRHPEVEIFEVAASDVEGVAPFMVYHGDESAVGSSSLNLNWKGDDLEGHEIYVETNRLENLIGDEIINIMKIDVEGYSLQVLKGLGDKLKQIKVLHIETETWTGSDLAIQRFLINRGFKLVDISEQYSGMPDQVWVNANPGG